MTATIPMYQMPAPDAVVNTREGWPHCLRCRRPCSSVELENEWTRGTPYSRPVFSGFALVTIECHGERAKLRMINV